MSGRYLLDTNIIIAIFSEEPAVLQRVAAAAEVFVPVIALGELYSSVLASRREPQRTSTASTSLLQRRRPWAAMLPRPNSTAGSRMICVPRAGRSRKTISGLRRLLPNMA